jgi:peptidyl-prolyl cis-trans isomerase-like 3
MAVTLKTDLGAIKLELFCEEAPAACENFLALCASGCYTGIVFHRIVPGFLIQCGDSTGTGAGGQTPFGAPVRAPPTDAFSSPWVLGYADAGDVRSQFFITVDSQPELNGRFCGFGRVVFGAHVVQAISRTPTLEDCYPIAPVAVASVVVHYNPFATGDLPSVLSRED